MTTATFLEKAKWLVDMHAKGLLGGEIMPEDALIGVVPEDELLNVITLGMSLNYQRSAYKLWESVAEAYRDKQSRWIFYPPTVSVSNISKLQEVLVRHRIALQPNRHPEIWMRVSNGMTLSSQKGDVLGLLESVQFDIAALKELMQVKRKSDFPYLSGPKIFNYWLYVLETYGKVVWTSRELITIAPDTHVLQATVKLGLCSEEVLNGSAQDRDTVAKAWESVLAGSNLTPIDVHTPLWLWSRAGFPSLDCPKYEMKGCQR